MLNLQFFGAAQTTTGSMHLVDWDGHLFLLDCGTLQGHRKETFERNRNFPFRPADIEAVVLSHAHVDHSGNLPTLVRQGFRGRIYATPATIDLCDLMLRDSAHIQKNDVERVNRWRKAQHKVPFELLYEEEDVDRTMQLFTPVDYHEPVELAKGLRMTFYNAGHILGAAQVCLDYERGGKPRRLLFSGDIGQRNMPILQDPETVPGVDVLLTECTYGDRNHPTEESVSARLRDYVSFICQHNSKLIVPAFSVGRTQQLLFYLNNLVERHKIDPIPVYVDSPLAHKATGVYRRHPECYNERAQALVAAGDDPFRFPGLHFTASVEDSMALNTTPGPMAIIAASGMCEAGRVLHHLKNNATDPLNIVLIVGFQAEGTLGRRIVEGIKVLKIFNEEYKLRASVFTINALSGHTDRTGLRAYAAALRPRLQHAFCVHGEPEYCEAHAQQLRELGIPKVEIPVRGQKYQNV